MTTCMKEKKYLLKWICTWNNVLLSFYSKQVNKCLYIKAYKLTSIYSATHIRMYKYFFFYLVFFYPPPYVLIYHLQIYVYINNTQYKDTHAQTN